MRDDFPVAVPPAVVNKQVVHKCSGCVEVRVLLVPVLIVPSRRKGRVVRDVDPIERSQDGPIGAPALHCLLRVLSAVEEHDIEAFLGLVE